MKTNLYEFIYSDILEKIQRGEYQAGDRLPSEMDLAQQFGVSRITSKKALEKLANEGLIERSRGKGSFVSSSTRVKLALAAADQAEAGLNPTAVRVFQVPNQKPTREQVVGVLIPDYDDTFGTRLVKEIQAQLQVSGYAMLLYRTCDSVENEKKAISSLLHLDVRGLIVVPAHGEFYNDDLLRLVLNHFPLVLVDRYLKNIPACSVYTDNFQAGKELAEHLISLGHKQFAFVSVQRHGTSSIEDRLFGFEEGLAQQGLQLKAQNCLENLSSSIPGNKDEEHARADMAMMAEFIQQNPAISAYMVCEYNLALLLYRTFVGLGARIPQDVSIVCFDSNANPFSSPLFTSIHQDEAGIARQAVDSLLSLIQGNEASLRVMVPHRLYIGETSGPVCKEKVY